MGPKRVDKKKKAAEEEAARKKAEEDAKVADLEAREKLVAQRIKESQADEKKMKQREDDLAKKTAVIDAREEDLRGREETIQKWMMERDEEWLTAQGPGMEAMSKKDRHAILIGVNQYDDPRLRDLHHSVENVREIGVALEQLNYMCEYIHDDLPDDNLPTKENIERVLTRAKQYDQVLVVIFVGHVVHGSLAPPRSSPVMRFLLPCNAPFEFSYDNIIPLDNLWDLMTVGTIDQRDIPFHRKGLLLVDGSYIGPTHESASMGYAVIKSTSESEYGVEYTRKHQALLSLAFCRALEGKVNVKGLIPSNRIIEYCHKKLNKLGIKSYCYTITEDSADFPVANKLLRPKHEIAATKEARKEIPCSFTLTFTVYHDLDAQNTILVKMISERLIDHCGQGVEIGKVELMGVSDLVLEGKIQSAVRTEKQKLWRDAVNSFTGVPDIPFVLISSDSTRPGDEGRSAVICEIITDSEAIIDQMRAKYAHLTHFFGHKCLDFRQHMQVMLHGTRQQFNVFSKVARRGGLDDSIFQFTGLHRSLYNIERFNVVDDERLAQLVLEGVALLIVSSDSTKATTKRNEALGRVADLEDFRGKIRFFYFDIPRDKHCPNVSILPGPDISNYLATNCVLLLDLRQGRTYAMLPGKSFFQGCFFPDSDIRLLCDDFLEGKLQLLNHRIPGANNHPRYRLL